MTPSTVHSDESKSLNSPRSRTSSCSARRSHSRKRVSSWATRPSSYACESGGACVGGRSASYACESGGACVGGRSGAIFARFTFRCHRQHVAGPRCRFFYVSEVRLIRPWRSSIKGDSSSSRGRLCDGRRGGGTHLRTTAPCRCVSLFARCVFLSVLSQSP